MPELKDTIRDLANEINFRFTPPQFIPGCEVKSITDKDEFQANNGWIEANVREHGQQRVRYFGWPQNVGTGNYVDVEYWPEMRQYRVSSIHQGGTINAGGAAGLDIRVDKVYLPNLTGTALYADAGGTIHFNGNLSIAAASDITVASRSIMDAIALMLRLPGLRGLWPMSSFNESGNAYDLSGQGRTLTYNGNPTYNYDGLAPYIDLDGTGDFLSRADEAGLDIIGTETYVGNPGLTFGGWFWLDSLAGSSFERLMCKDDVSNRSYGIYFQESNDTLNFELHVTTPATRTVTSGAVGAAQTWFFVVARFVPGSEMSIFLDGTETVSSITDAAIVNSTAAFEIGRLGNGTQLFTGRASLCFLCASALSDDMIDNIFQQSRNLFGV